MTTTTDPTVTLSAADLGPFDDSSIGLIRAMEAAGWRGRVSNRGHAIMRAPDGHTTASVSRDHDKRRANSRNAWAEFRRWQDRATPEPPTPEETPMATVLVCPECQATFPDTKALKAHTADVHKPMRPAHPCPECGEVWWSPQALRLHLVRKHPDTDALPPADPTPCPECGHVARSPNALNVHLRNVHSDGTCPVCGKGVRMAQLTRHLGQAHHELSHEAKVALLAAPVVVVRPTKAPELTPETPRPAEAEQVPEAHNVVLDYLVEVTTGKDAEAMVAAIRAVVAPPLVDEVRRLREHNTKLEAELDDTSRALGEANARLSIMREALGL